MNREQHHQIVILAAAKALEAGMDPGTVVDFLKQIQETRWHEPDFWEALDHAETNRTTRTLRPEAMTE